MVRGARRERAAALPLPRVGDRGATPVLAGLALALLFLTRPHTSLFGLFFLVEAMRVARRSNELEPRTEVAVHRVRLRCVGVDFFASARTLARFAAPLLAAGLVAALYNYARFDDPFEFGHSFLQIYWRDRIEKWGLFNYHYVSKNLRVFLAALPWFSAHAPHLVVSRHGLALWVTTPHVLLAALRSA